MVYQCDPCQCPEQYYRNDQTYKKGIIKLLCDLIGWIQEITTPSENAAFAALVELDSSDIGAGYASAVDLPDGTKSVSFSNQMNGDVYVSMTAGVSDTFHVAAGTQLHINLVGLGLITSADVHVKDGKTVPDAGYFFISSIS